MRLVITGILAFIILIMICAFDKKNAGNSRTISIPVSPKTATEYQHFIPHYYYEWKNSLILPKTSEKNFLLIHST